MYMFTCNIQYASEYVFMYSICLYVHVHIHEYIYIYICAYASAACVLMTAGLGTQQPQSACDTGDGRNVPVSTHELGST